MNHGEETRGKKWRLQERKRRGIRELGLQIRGTDSWKDNPAISRLNFKLLAQTEAVSPH